MSRVVSFCFWRINIISKHFRTFHIVLEENYIAIIIVIELSPSPSSAQFRIWRMGFLSSILYVYSSIHPIYLSIYLPTYLSIYLSSIYPSIYLWNDLSIHTSINTFVHLCLSVCLSIYHPFIHLSVKWSVNSYFYQYICPSLSVCLSIYLSGLWTLNSS